MGVFLTLWRRDQARKTGNRAIESLPYDFAGIPFRNILKAPGSPRYLLILSVAHSLVNRLIQMNCALSAARFNTTNSSEWLEAAIRRTQSGDQLHFVRRLGSDRRSGKSRVRFPKVHEVAHGARARSAPQCCEAIFRNPTHVMAADVEMLINETRWRVEGIISLNRERCDSIRR